MSQVVRIFRPWLGNSWSRARTHFSKDQNALLTRRTSLNLPEYFSENFRWTTLIFLGNFLMVRIKTIWNFHKKNLWKFQKNSLVIPRKSAFIVPKRTWISHNNYPELVWISPNKFLQLPRDPPWTSPKEFLSLSDQLTPSKQTF